MCCIVYSGTVAELEKESQLMMEPFALKKMKLLVKEGNWDAANFII